ncbi:MAG: GNAT family N-acetyltransferase [Acidimicrobiia bacterium]
MVATELLRTPRLTLTPLTATDAVQMVEVLSNPSLYEFIGGEPPTLSSLAELYAFQTAGSPREDEIWHNWVMRLEDSAIGYVQATVIANEAEMAWVVGIPWQGRGYATEAARSMMDWLALRGATQFTAHIHPDHSASQAVARSVGHEATGVLDDEDEMIWASGD